MFIEIERLEQLHGTKSTQDLGRETLEEQEGLKISKGIIAILFRDYWATEDQSLFKKG